MSNKTAMQDLIDIFNNHIEKNININWSDDEENLKKVELSTLHAMKKEAEKLLNKEEKQIEQAATWGSLFETGKQYYKEKFK
jgi:HD-like signal output (HDOD) protein